MEPEGSLLDSEALRLREEEGVAMVAKAAEAGAGAGAAVVTVEFLDEFFEFPLLLVVGCCFRIPAIRALLLAVGGILRATAAGGCWGSSWWV